MLRMNRYFNGGGTHNWISASSGPPRNGLMKWGNHCCASGGPGRIDGAVPDGYGVENALHMPIKGGAMRAYAYDFATLSGTLNVLNGGAMAVLDGSMTMTVTGDMGLITSLSGDGAISLTYADPSLALTLGLEGTAAITFDFDDVILAIIDPISGSFSSTLVGEGAVRSKLSMEGSWGQEDPTAAFLDRILALLEADEYHTATQVIKKARGTGTILLTKNWTGTPLASFEAVE